MFYRKEKHIHIQYIQYLLDYKYCIAISVQAKNTFHMHNDEYNLSLNVVNERSLGKNTESVSI